MFTYAATKAAVHNLSANLAREWALLGIRVNTLVPGFFPAEQNRKVLTPDLVDQIMQGSWPDEQIALLGSPEPKAIIWRRKRDGTGIGKK